MEKKGLYHPSFEHDACGIGVIANIDGHKNHQTVDDALTVIENLDHRGASGADMVTGDGAGILIQLPHAFFHEVLSFDLPHVGEYAVMQAFLSNDIKKLNEQLKSIEDILMKHDYQLLGTREVPTAKHILGDLALSSMPYMMQCFITKHEPMKDDQVFEYDLYKLRKKLEHAFNHVPDFYIASLSSKTIVYKGMLTSLQLRHFFIDLQDLRFQSAFALVHARFSTNTFPSWHRAHPNRYMIHNGEINTIRGNVNWMRSRQARLKNTYPDIHDLLPIIDETGSDSSMFDNALEFLVRTGRSLPHALMMMIPEPWENNKAMNQTKRAFYAYHNFLMEPWEGPAAIAASDGDVIVASLDRNGLRPSRYTITKDNRLILASEVGVLDIKPDNILQKGRLMPGKMLVVDLLKQEIIADEEVKMALASAHDYDQMINEHLVSLEDFETSQEARLIEETDLLTLKKAYGYTTEDIEKIIQPMALHAKEPIGSMGFDAPLAILSEKPQLLYNYFKHAFAQVTNPPLDGLREEIITSSKVMMGSMGHLLKPFRDSKYATLLDGPIITNGQLANIKAFDNKVFKTKTLSTLYEKAKGTDELERHLDRMYEEARHAYDEGYNLFILSDRGLDEKHVAAPMLLAASGLHHFFINEEIRTEISIICETAEAREVHHFAALFGYGVTAINPYLVYEILKDLTYSGKLKDYAHYTPLKKQYITASVNGMMKILSKMGISTLRSYHGTQLFEALGIHEEVVNKYFTGTITRIGGLKLKDIALEMHKLHDKAYQSEKKLDVGSRYFNKKDGEPHLLTPSMIKLIHKAARENDQEAYETFSKSLYEMKPVYLRHLLDFNSGGIKAIPLREVESVESILMHFKSGAMSYGSISKEAHETVAIAMNKMQAKSNSGEGGEDSERYDTDRASQIKQVASGRFGVTLDYLIHANEIQIKMAQGAKPGEGGHLPGEKVYPWIAKTRHAKPWVSLISPPPHHDIYSIEDLAELIYDLKKANHKARINVKLVSQAGVGTVSVGVAKGFADVILISGYDGGTGAAPFSSLQHAGLPWEIGLSEVHQTLAMNKLRNRVALETDGKLLTGRDIAVAAILGAEEFGFATLPLLLVGCVMLRACHKNTCPVGIATQKEELRKRFKGQPEHIINYFTFVADELRSIMASLGIKTLKELVGRTDLLRVKPYQENDKTALIDFSGILQSSNTLSDEDKKQTESSLDEETLMPVIRASFDPTKKQRYQFNIHNINRSVGTYVGSYLKAHYKHTLTDDTLTLDFYGSAGQSFGAFIPKGMTLNLRGDANDYLGKGLSGGRIIVMPPDEIGYDVFDNMIVGNVSFYGATSGEGYIEGVAGERFGVRNSGATLVVLGVGDHACEYMTGGTVVILGKTGRNMAAGMSGGAIYVYDLDVSSVNQDMVSVVVLDDTDKETLLKILDTYDYMTNNQSIERFNMDRFSKIETITKNN